MQFKWSVVAVICLAIWCSASAMAQVAGVERVVVIGIDGLGPAGIAQADTPHLDALIAEGAHTFKARAVMPTKSSPNWASMIMGAGPEQHGVLSNAWTPFTFDVPPTVEGPGKIFPTIFSAVREQKPGAYQAVIHHWRGFGILFERKMVDQIEHGVTQQETTQQAIACLREHRPDFLFVHLDHVDAALHGQGWLTPAYLTAVTEADALIGEIVAALKAEGLYDTTALLVTSDHGGKDKGHGGASLQELEIPWIIRGPSVRSGITLQAPVNTYDTAATVAYLFGLKAPEAWIAKPVTEAFGTE